MSQSPSLDPVVRLELPVIARIIQDEVWLEAERRGVPVSANDPVVQEKICSIILRVGHDLRQHFETVAAREISVSAECSEQAEQSRAA